jgi:hypothetical protein
MRRWTMRRADVLLSTVMALGCGRTAPATSPLVDAAPPSIPEASVPAGPSALVRIEAFDCEKHEVFPNEPPPKGLIAPAVGLRAWKGGGPYGATWNADALRCTARARTSCDRGKVLFTLRVGQYVVAEKEGTISKGVADVEVVLPAAIWERGYDSAPKADALRLPFKTAGFRAQAALDCDAPTKASLRDWNYRFVVADDAFVAGFANGE